MISLQLTYSYALQIDPYKEPPMGVVNTALSVMAYEYYYSQGGQKKVSVYVSDDGGSQLTLFAFIEAAKFARHWLPFCRENGVEVRAPEVYFKTHCCGIRSEEIQIFSGWGMLYVFLFVGAYGQDLLDFILAKGTIPRWWNCQRMWMICGLSSFLFGLTEYTLKHLGIPVQGFNITSKIQDDDLGKRYGQGSYEFGVESPMFLPISIAAVINLVALVVWVCLAGGKDLDNVLNKLGLEILLCAFAVVNSWPVYEAMFLRSDKGRMPSKVTLLSVLLVLPLCLMSVAAAQLCPAPPDSATNLLLMFM